MAKFPELEEFDWQGHAMLRRVRGERVKVWPVDHRQSPFDVALWPIECAVGQEQEDIARHIEAATELEPHMITLEIARDNFRTLDAEQLVDYIQAERPDW